MIPTISTTSAFDVPLTLRPPTDEEISDDGIGGIFRDVWYIAPGWPVADVDDLLAWESSAVAVIDSLTTTPEEFETLAYVIEGFVTDGDLTIDPSEYPELSDNERTALQERLDEGTYLLDGIDLGVAGLVAALSSAGFYPAASCRGHATLPAWSDRPTVFFAGEKSRAGMLRDAILSTGCRLSSGAGNGEHLAVIQAPSVVAAIDLGREIFKLRIGAASQASQE